jgi:hypothetical protein
MDSSQIILSGNKERDIHAIAQYIENHIDKPITHYPLPITKKLSL